MKALTLSLVVVLTSAPAAFAADATAQPTLTLEGAERAVAAAIYARAHGAPGAAVTVVDAEEVYRSAPFDPPKFFDDRRKQLPLSGVYSRNDDRLRLDTRELEGPAVIVFPPPLPGIRS